MTQQEKKAYNFDNEMAYYYAPFSEQRKQLRSEWSRTRRGWDSFLYDQEKKHRKSKSE